MLKFVKVYLNVSLGWSRYQSRSQLNQWTVSFSANIIMQKANASTMEWRFMRQLVRNFSWRMVSMYGHRSKTKGVVDFALPAFWILVLVSPLLNSLIVLKNNKFFQLNVLYCCLVWEVLYGSQPFLKLHCANITTCEVKFCLVSKPNICANK